MAPIRRQEQVQRSRVAPADDERSRSLDEALSEQCAEAGRLDLVGDDAGEPVDAATRAAS